MCNEQFDDLFKNIKTLKWLPWVGNNFISIEPENRMLIIGESHYHDNSDESINKHENPSFTRLVLDEQAIKLYNYGPKIFPNLHKVLFENNNFNSSIFWELASFYNFIQRPMVTNKGRPSKMDFYDSWSTFFEVIKILKPKTCLFIGTSSANYLNKGIKNSGFTIKELKWETKINGAYTKTATIEDNNGNETLLFFIKHTSQRFSWQEWNGYLKQKMNPQLNFFKAKLNNETME